MTEISFPADMIADQITEEVGKTGFRCLQCAECCTEVEPGSNLVMLSPDEIRRIMRSTGFSWDEIAEPYPDKVMQEGAYFSFEWALKRKGDHCLFLSGGRCTIYPDRPWICRTYPFMLQGNRLESSRCRGLGSPIGKEAAGVLAEDLIGRRDAEDQEEKRILDVFRESEIPAGFRGVIDGEGLKVLNG